MAFLSIYFGIYIYIYARKNYKNRDISPSNFDKIPDYPVLMYAKFLTKFCDA